jgi:hypothetical protein
MLARLAGLWLIATACSNATSLALDPACNPLGDGHCMTPWPSSVFEVDDPTTATGRRLAIPDGALPRNADGAAVDPAGWNAADGFSPAAPIAMAWRGGVSPDDLPPIDNPGLSLADDSPTVILDMTTGARVAHYAELDAQAANRPDAQALLLRPAARLAGGHRYAVAITRRVRAPDGGDLAVPAGFAALRDHRDTDHPLLEAMRPRFGEVLAALEAAGIASDALVVAWDFTVASDDFLHRDLTYARDRALAALADHPIGFTVAADAPIDDGRAIRRRITGTIDAPLLLTQGGAAAPGTHLARDAAGLPAVHGTTQVPFTAIVPACAYTAAAPVPMIVYGHGLFGSAAEVASPESQLAAGALCAVIAGTDMRGMSMRDLPAFARALADAGHADEVMDVVAQGIVNHVALVRALRTELARQLFVDRARGRPLVDPERVYYYGVAQGSVLGASVLAYEPTMTRGVLVAAAANYSTLLERSTDWALYRALLATAYPDPLDAAMVVGLFQMRWDKVEGAGVADRLLAGTGEPAKQVLLQVALGDDQVANIGSYWLARTMGIPVVGPAPTTPWGLAVQPGPLPGGSAMLILDGGAPPPPAANLPPPELGMHRLPRIEPAALRQIHRFYATGEIINPCAGPCVCLTGACE